jgi:hypothetical protein
MVYQDLFSNVQHPAVDSTFVASPRESVRRDSDITPSPINCCASSRATLSQCATPKARSKDCGCAKSTRKDYQILGNSRMSRIARIWASLNEMRTSRSGSPFRSVEAFATFCDMQLMAEKLFGNSTCEVRKVRPGGQVVSFYRRHKRVPNPRRSKRAEQGIDGFVIASTRQHANWLAPARL